MAGAGPVSNFLLAVVFTLGLLLVGFFLGPSGIGDPAARIFEAGVIVNVALGVFNLVPPVPLPPLDGSWVASCGLPRALGEAYDRVVRPYGSWILLLLVFTGALSAVTRPVIGLVLQSLGRLIAY